MQKMTLKKLEKIIKLLKLQKKKIHFFNSLFKMFFCKMFIFEMNLNLY